LFGAERSFPRWRFGLRSGARRVEHRGHPISNRKLHTSNVSEADADAIAGPHLQSPRKIALQLLGFALGLVLLAWVIYRAISKASGTEPGQISGWQRLRDTDPALIAGLLLCTIVSLGANGAIFWLVIQPVKPLRHVHMQLLNLVTSVLNYAPLRAGLIARVAYHLRVDRLGIITIGAWFTAIGFTLMLTLGAVVAATFLRPHFDWLWWLVLVTQLVIGAWVTRSFMRLDRFSRWGKVAGGLDRMLADNRALWGAISLRLIDVMAYTGRMACAVAILQLPFTFREILLLSIAAIVVSLFPLGRVGYREAGVAFVAGLFGMAGDPGAHSSQLALIDSAGEALVSIPLGALALLWYRARWIRARDTSHKP
jgi:hypothetical protein